MLKRIQSKSRPTTSPFKIHLLNCAGAIFALTLLATRAALAGDDLAPVPPARVNGVTMIEPPLQYRVDLEITVPGHEPIRFSIDQPNHAYDRQKLSLPSAERGAEGQKWAIYYDFLDPVDRHYREHGFQPLNEPLFIQPATSQRSYLLTPNDPTTRQICGGFAMASLWGGEFFLATDSIWKVVQLCPRIDNEAEVASGDVVVWFDKGREADGTPKSTGISHYALLENMDGLSYIYTKNGFERAYYGRLSDYNAQPPPGMRSLKSRLTGDAEKMEHTFYRVPWDEIVVKRNGRRHADEMLPDGSTPLRFQVVDAATYEVLPGARVWMTFAGANDVLVDKLVDGDGAATAEQVPGNGGAFDVRASLAGYENGFCKAMIEAGEKVNIIIPLKERRGGDDAVKERFIALQAELEVVVFQWTKALRSNEVAKAESFAPRIAELNEQIGNLWEYHPHLDKFFNDISTQSYERVNKRIETELGSQ